MQTVYAIQKIYANLREKKPKSLSQYLFKMVYHKAMNRIANELAIHKANTMFFEQTQKMLEEIDLYQFEELQALLRKAIQDLPENYREALSCIGFSTRITRK